MAIGWIELILGLIILVVGGEYLVRASVKLALYFRISSLVIGLTVVSFGTSFPELVVSIDAAISGHDDIAVGNVVGSNIANIALILGLTAILFPLIVSRTVLMSDWPFMILTTLLLVILSWDLRLEAWEGAILLVLLFVYNILSIRNSRKTASQESTEDARYSGPDLARTCLIFAASLVALVLGADLLVDGAVIIAQSFGVEERVIAVTIIAFGTSAPELATSMVAVYRKEAGISIGNLVGSNIFNILGILGITSLITPLHIHPATKSSDFFWFLGIPLLFYPLLLLRSKVTRLKGVILFAAYLVYLWLFF